jgi:hypothetical protein
VDVPKLGELERTVYLGARDGAVDPEAAFDLATGILETYPLDADAAELAELSVAGGDQPRLIEAAGRVLGRWFDPGFDEEPGWLAALQDAMRIVNQDVAATGLPGACRLEVPAWSQGNAYVLTWDNYTDSGVGIAPECGRDTVRALTEVADDAQGAIMESTWGAWPVCPRHQLGTHAEEHDGAAVWWCKGNGGHVVAAIGQWVGLEAGGGWSLS